MTNAIEKTLEILWNYMEIVHESEREPYNELEFLKSCNEPRNVMESLYFILFGLIKINIYIPLYFIKSTTIPQIINSTANIKLDSIKFKPRW